MALWRGPSQSSKLNHPSSAVYSPNQCSPGSSNPDDNAIHLTLQFPQYSYPVFFPSSAPETCSFFLRYSVLVSCDYHMAFM